MRYAGVEASQIRSDGALVLSARYGQLVEQAPYIYQEIAGLRVQGQGPSGV